jgi:hypothetical protein
LGEPYSAEVTTKLAAALAPDGTVTSSGDAGSVTIVVPAGGVTTTL